MIDIIEENNQYSPKLIVFNEEYLFSLNPSAWKNNVLVRAISYEKNDTSSQSIPIDKNQLMINEEITYQRRVKIFMDQFNQLEKMERLMFIHKYFNSYLNKSLEELAKDLSVSKKTLSKYKKRAIEKMITSCWLDMWSTMEYGNFVQGSNEIEDDRRERWEKLGLTYHRIFERVEFDWEE
ncbi:hypothetical protein [Bulleidia sp. zg-1006]|nr:hypothetical protein [Bulleidia sp. zg-1006]QRG86922.1 hypothetical protein JOS54_00985 [Bulleidia sp. zg-1006]